MWNLIKDLFGVGANITVIVAGIAGLYLALLFYRDTTPHMDIDHEIEHIELTRDVNLLRVSVVLKNTGKVKNVIRCEVIRVHQVRPLPASVETNLSSLKTPMSLTSFAGEAWQPVKHLDWEQVKIWGYDYKETEMPLIEPGEQDAFEYEFPLPSDVDTVKIYSFFMNERDSPAGAECARDYRSQVDVIGRGWSRTSLYKLEATAGPKGS